MQNRVKFERSLALTVFGILLLFGFAIGATVIAPKYCDSSWTNPCSFYQTQMYEVADPNIYVNAANPEVDVLQYVRHLKEGFSLLAFEESEEIRFIAPEDLEKYITHTDEKPLKLTNKLILLKEADAQAEPVIQLRSRLKKEWQEKHPQAEIVPYFSILELYVPGQKEAFAVTDSDGVQENWIEKDFTILDEGPLAFWHQDPGVIFVKNPREYRIVNTKNFYHYDPSGKKVGTLSELQKLGFISRKELIQMGEEIYKIEGCWYCHTDQSRTLVQDCVVNGSDSFPAPPSCANEYIHQEVTFPGTRRIGPDLSRVGVKRPSRDWHEGHFWMPASKSKGSIMPAFKHFFNDEKIANCKFEAIFQYLMTKGTRITSPTEAWWLGLDPVQTIKIIEDEK